MMTNVQFARQLLRSIAKMREETAKRQSETYYTDWLDTLVNDIEERCKEQIAIEEEKNTLQAFIESNPERAFALMLSVSLLLSFFAGLLQSLLR